MMLESMAEREQARDDSRKASMFKSTAHNTLDCSSGFTGFIQGIALFLINGIKLCATDDERELQKRQAAHTA